MTEQDPITKEEFERFERVRASGHINMWDAKNGARLSGLTRDRYTAVMEHYTWAMTKWPDVRKEDK